MSDLTTERLEALWLSAQPGHYADCVHAADEPVCACWTECADGLAETLAALTAAAEREGALCGALEAQAVEIRRLAQSAEHWKGIAGKQAVLLGLTAPAPPQGEKP